MTYPIHFRRRGSELACALSVLFFLVPMTTRARPDEQTSLTVVVKEADTNDPINQAHLTLQFRKPGDAGKLKLPKHLAFTAKTNSQGRYRFANIPKGTIRLLVTADRHQSFGKEFELTEDNQVIEVKLKRPQPLL
jgi:hypothetical protein